MLSKVKAVSSHPKICKRIGFLSTRFAGTDGVSLESAKWAQVLEEAGAECFWMAGLLDRPADRSHLEPLAFFHHPEVLAIQRQLFDSTERSPQLERSVEKMKEQLKASIRAFIANHAIELLILENVLAIPMHVPLGLAVNEVIAESGIPALAHHHDFAWERERFSVPWAAEYLRAAFPPLTPGIRHVVINSLQQRELVRRHGLQSTVVPNVMDFDTRPSGIDDYTIDLRRELGLADDDILVLQPTRIVARKGIELAIELIRKLGMPNLKLVLSHPPGDEGYDYLHRIEETARAASVECVKVWERIGGARGKDASGQKIYTLEDLYSHADLVTYPSHYEGFGNAFLEAVYFGKPVVVNSYPVFTADIGPLGFHTIALTGQITDEALQQTRDVLKSGELRKRWAEENFELGRQNFSYTVLRRLLFESLDGML